MVENPPNPEYAKKIGGYEEIKAALSLEVLSAIPEKAVNLIEKIRQASLGI
jgi:hypothetical protein